jgi:hypothetical protein
MSNIITSNLSSKISRKGEVKIGVVMSNKNESVNLHKLTDDTHRVKLISNFLNGYEVDMNLRIYSTLFEKGIIDPSPTYQRPYHYNDNSDEYWGSSWQQNIISDIVSGSKIPSISLREINESIPLKLDKESLLMLIQEIIDGGHRTRTICNFLSGLLKTARGLKYPLNGTVYRIGDMTFPEFDMKVQNDILNNRFLRFDVYQKLDDDGAGEKFRILNDLHDMTAQEKRNSRRTQISKSTRHLADMSVTDFSIFSKNKDAMKFKYIKLPYTGRVTDELVAAVSYTLNENTVRDNISDTESFKTLWPSKLELDNVYKEDDKEKDVNSTSPYVLNSKLLTRVDNIFNVIDDIITLNYHQKNFTTKVWTKNSLFKLALLLDDWIEVYGLESIKRMDTRKFYKKLMALLNNPRHAKFESYNRWKIDNGKLKSIYKKQQDRVTEGTIVTVWNTGNRIDDYEYIKLSIELNWNPSEWGIFKLDKRRFFTEAQKQEIFDRDNHTCVECGSTENLHADHIIPWTKGGPTEVSNGQTLCNLCNWDKSDSIDLDSLQSLSELELDELFKNDRISRKEFLEAVK